MKTQWKIKYFVPQTADRSPLVPFIESLSEKTQGKLSNTFSLLQEFGTRVGMPHVKKVTGTSLRELRILGQDNVRIFYTAYEEKTFLLLHGFVKKKQKTPPRELRIALERFKEFQKNQENKGT